MADRLPAEATACTVDPVPVMSEFERSRQIRIQNNMAKLNELRLKELASDLAVDSAKVARDGADGPKRKHRKEKDENQQPVAPMRASRRMAGIAAELPAGISMGMEQEKRLEAGPDDKESGRARAKIRFPELPPKSTVVAPFTLRSIRTTVWDVGTIHRGSFAHRYWSSKGCLYHHAYPIGYRAAKAQFGREYSMEIALGDVGPVFRVVDDGNGEVFAGESPTKPWTDVCLAKKAGTRISGPQFFGFSDAITIRAIAALCTQEELDACRRGETVATAAPSAEEIAAAEFTRVEGVGERTAIALARTAALPGAPLRTLSDLQAVAKAQGRAVLEAFLTTSTEIPEATRRWPAWRKRLVPAIIAALQSGDPTASSRPAAKERSKRARDDGGAEADDCAGGCAAAAAAASTAAALAAADDAGLKGPAARSKPAGTKRAKAAKLEAAVAAADGGPEGTQGAPDAVVKSAKKRAAAGAAAAAGASAEGGEEQAGAKRGRKRAASGAEREAQGELPASSAAAAAPAGEGEKCKEAHKSALLPQESGAEQQQGRGDGEATTTAPKEGGKEVAAAVPQQTGAGGAPPSSPPAATATVPSPQAAVAHPAGAAVAAERAQKPVAAAVEERGAAGGKKGGGSKAGADGGKKRAGAAASAAKQAGAVKVKTLLSFFAKVPT